MTDETDIYRVAHEYIKQYGDYADIQARMSANDPKRTSGNLMHPRTLLPLQRP